jgi:effector-binding domain-containing protein
MLEITVLYSKIKKNVRERGGCGGRGWKQKYIEKQTRKYMKNQGLFISEEYKICQNIKNPLFFVFFFLNILPIHLPRQ